MRVFEPSSLEFKMFRAWSLENVKPMTSERLRKLRVCNIGRLNIGRVELEAVLRLMFKI